MIEEMKAILEKDLPLITNLSNASSVLNLMDNINWCGFYIAYGETLYLGPFQGDVACTVIPFGKGVCGESAKTKKTIIVPNVLEYPNHIACSSLSRSEIVVPIMKSDCVLGVIDIDSPIFNRFTDEDKKVLEEVAKLLSEIWS